jgi:hypothetical protein
VLPSIMRVMMAEAPQPKDSNHLPVSISYSSVHLQVLKRNIQCLGHDNLPGQRPTAFCSTYQNVPYCWDLLTQCKEGTENSIISYRARTLMYFCTFHVLFSLFNTAYVLILQEHLLLSRVNAYTTNAIIVIKRR